MSDIVLLASHWPTRYLIFGYIGADWTMIHQAAERQGLYKLLLMPGFGSPDS